MIASIASAFTPCTMRPNRLQCDANRRKSLCLHGGFKCRRVFCRSSFMQGRPEPPQCPDRPPGDRRLDRPRQAGAGKAHRRTRSARRQAPGERADLLPRLDGAAHHRRSHRGARRSLERGGGVRPVSATASGCGSAPVPITPTARWRNTASRCPSRCATSRSRRTFWDYEDIAPHWDKLILRAHIVENGARVLIRKGR